MQEERGDSEVLALPAETNRAMGCISNVMYERLHFLFYHPQQWAVMRRWEMGGASWALWTCHRPEARLLWTFAVSNIWALHWDYGDFCTAIYRTWWKPHLHWLVPITRASNHSCHSELCSRLCWSLMKKDGTRSVRCSLQSGETGVERRIKRMQLWEQKLLGPPALLHLHQ